VGQGEVDPEKNPALPILKKDESGANRKIEVVKQHTKAPALYTEATLLTAMETAGKALDDDELAGAMKERGLGTPATRAATIEKLLAAGKTGPYMERQGNHLAPTPKGLSLIAHLKTSSPKMVSPVLTGEWEHKLLQMEKGKHDRASFMSEIAAFVQELVITAAQGASHMGGGEACGIGAPCPKCGGTLIFDGRVVRHEDESVCEFKLWGRVSSRALSHEELEELITKGELPTMKGFLSKEKKPFEAGLRLSDDKGTLEFVFGKPVETKLPCPSCKSRLVTDGRKISCECGFSMWAVVAGVRLSDPQVAELLVNGRTAVIDGFKSKAGKKFSAALVFDQEKKTVSFDFAGVQNSAEKHSADEKCPKCKKGKLTNKQNKEGKAFLGCSGYPACRFFEWI
jgi:DNA topoisomerase-3